MALGQDSRHYTAVYTRTITHLAVGPNSNAIGKWTVHRRLLNAVGGLSGGKDNHTASKVKEVILSNIP